MKRQRILPLPVVFALLCTVTGRAQVTIPITDRVATTPGADNGLNGFYWQRPTNSILVDGNSVPANSISTQMDSFGAPTGTFIAHNLAYFGNDLTEVAGTFGNGPWLGGDAGSYGGSMTNNLDDGAFRFFGFLYVPTPVTVSYGTTSDDGSRIRIGTVDILGGANDGSHADQTVDMDVIFAAAGLYPFRVDYFNGDWTSDGNNHTGNPDPTIHGGGNLTIREAFGPMVETNLYRNIPEPGGLVLGLAGLVGMLALRRRRR